MRTALSGWMMLLVLGCSAGVHGNRDRADVALIKDAQTTYLHQVNAVNSGAERLDESGIPAEDWAPSIAALHPVKVYAHRANLVVVQEVIGDDERGMYITLPISSYLPRSGDDGFLFHPDPRAGRTDVFQFRRRVTR